MVKKAVMMFFVVLFLAILATISLAEQSCVADPDCGPLQCGGIYSSICFQGKCAPLHFSENPCGKPFATAFVKPTFAASWNSTFGITIWTSSDASCRYSVILLKDSYDSMIAFEQTGQRLHSLSSYSPASATTPFFTKCRSSFGDITSGFLILKDPTPPIVAVTASPTIVTDLPFSTSITVTSDDAVVCKYDAAGKNTYDEMNTFFTKDNEANFSTYTTKKSHTIAGLQDNYNYSFNVSCKNLAGNISQTSMVNVAVDSSIEGFIINTTPSDGSIFPRTSFFFETYTTRSSFCYYSNTSSSDSEIKLIDVVEGTHHLLSPNMTLPPGKYSYNIRCTFKSAQQLKTAVVNFIIDPTPPIILSINDSPRTGSSSTYSVTSLAVKWNAEDNESDVDLYNYSVIDSSSQLIKDWTTTTRTEVTLDGLSLENSKTYYFFVKAKNGAGMWSSVIRSLGITVDTSKAPVSCTNKILDGNETDIDCGGGKCPICISGKMCNSDADCKTGYCRTGICAAASCTDSVMNHGETDIDCGGPCSAKCLDIQGCLINQDCQSQSCVKNYCVKKDSCANGLLDSGETGIDCGGICAELKNKKCTLGSACVVDGDCFSGICNISGLCVQEEAKPPVIVPVAPPVKKSGNGLLITLIVVIFLLIGAILAYIYYRKTVSPSMAAPVSKMPYFQIPPQNPQPQNMPQRPSFESVSDKKIQGMERVFNTFEGQSPVASPPPTDNIFDKFADIPVKSSEDVFKELRRQVEEEEQLKRRRQGPK